MVTFDNLQGQAQKSEVTYMKLADGDNTFRIVGNILPGYFYWIKGQNGKDLPFECLQFDREAERFNQSLPDPVKELGLEDGQGKPIRCGWAYRCQVINKATGKLEVLSLKKGMLQDIITYSKKKGINPTDFENGVWLTVTREKTGPKAFNVKYTVDPFCFANPEPLTDEEKESVEKMKPINDLFPRETAEEQRARLDKHLNGDESSAESEAEKESANEAVNELDD